jgi:hypothetical protein
MINLKYEINKLVKNDTDIFCLNILEIRVAINFDGQIHGGKNFGQNLSLGHVTEGVPIKIQVDSVLVFVECGC